jgi:hypothetical protein
VIETVPNPNVAPSPPTVVVRHDKGPWAPFKDAFLVVFLCAASAGAAFAVAKLQDKGYLTKITGQVEEPYIRLPKEISGEMGSLLKLQAETNCGAIRWMPLAPAGSLFVESPPGGDTKTVYLTGKPGQYQIVGMGAKNDLVADPGITMVKITEPAK